MVLFMKDDQEDELEPDGEEEFCDDCNRTLDECECYYPEDTRHDFERDN